MTRRVRKATTYPAAAVVPGFSTTCKRCGRPLRAERTQAIGYGLICLRRARSAWDEAQTTIAAITNVETGQRYLVDLESGRPLSFA